MTTAIAAGLAAGGMLATLLGVCLLFRSGRSAERDRAALEWTEEKDRRDRRLFAKAGRKELTAYRDVAVAIRGPTSLAEREVAEIFERKDF